MKLKSLYKEYCDVHKKVTELIDDLIETLESAIQNTTPPGVTKASKSPPRIVMSVSSLLSGSWDPEKYIPSRQAKVVADKLRSCKTPEAVAEAVRKMLDNKNVAHGREITPLNDTTLNLIRESELGRFVISEMLPDPAVDGA